MEPVCFCDGDEASDHHACMNGHLPTAHQSEIRKAYLVSVLLTKKLHQFSTEDFSLLQIKLWHSVYFFDIISDKGRRLLPRGIGKVILFEERV